MIEIREFDIEINKASVLGALGCMEGSSVYDTVSQYFDELLKTVSKLFKPCAAAVIEDGKIYCLLTVGADVSDYSKSLFDSGEGMRGMIADAMADDYLFQMDNALGERIKLEGAIGKFGVKKRLAAPEDFPISQQRIILEKTGLESVSLTSAFMFEPVKSFGYILELTRDMSIFKAQHDCSQCANYDCPRRSRISSPDFSVLSAYDYKADIKKGESVVCIDIGTTTVVFELVTEIGTVRTYKTVNPQRRFGLDVLSRIEAANRGRGDELSSLIRYAVLSGYKEVTEGFGDADRVVIAGNTTMVYLLMNYPCVSLGEYPFKAEHLGTVKTTLDRVTDSEVKSIEAVIFGGISAFVGGDITSGMYMCDFDVSDKVNLFIDLGTNGEMAIGNKDRIIATSAAAGPAFEGGRISCGVGSIDGAICGIDIADNEIKTIGNKPPVGLCGTGIIELVSEMLDNNIMDKTGLLCDNCFVNGYKAADDVFFTQDDIRQVQMAKAAVRAGIECLMVRYGAGYDDINKVYLAGGFGYGLSLDKACNMGILPKEFLGKTEVIGNSSLGGCVKYASLPDGDKRIKHIQQISEEFPLGNNEAFEKMYIEYMNF